MPPKLNAVSQFIGMIKVERALGTQGRYISPVLLALGWRRKRKWGTTRQYCRYWVPPV